MPGFGIPGENTGTGEAFLGRIQFDTRVGFWTIVKRIQFSDGSWGDEKSEPFPSSKKFLLLMDFGSVEAGYINFSSPPQFLLVPYGQAYPQQPQEMRTDADGKARKAFQAGFRIKVQAPSLFGDAEAYHFAHSSATVMTVMGALLDHVIAAPEFAAGRIPLVAITGNESREFGNRGAKFYAPIFEVRAWHARPEVFGERTVPATGQGTPPAAPQPAARPAQPAPRPAGGNGAAVAPRPAPARPAPAAPMAEPAWDEARMTPPARAPGGGGNFDDLNDEVPF